MKFLVVGTNFISDLFADAIARLASDGADAKIGAVLSRREETGRAFLARNSVALADGENPGGAAVARDLEGAYELFLRGAFDAAYVASPNVCHEVQSVFFLERGVPVLCEKPAALSPESLSRVGEAAERGKAVFMEAMRPSHDPVVREALKRAVAEIAPVRSARLEFSQYSSRYDRFLAGEAVNTFDPGMGNSALGDLGVYALAVAQTLFGEPSNVGGATAARLENSFEASGAALFEYPTFVCAASWSKVCGPSAPSVILGERGAISIDRLSEPKDVRVRRGAGDFEPLDIGAAENNMVFEIADFIAAVGGDRSLADAFFADSWARSRLVAAISAAQSASPR